MGEPYFRIKGLLDAKGVAVCSGNLSAYREISDKVMRVLSKYTDSLEVYSIDEAFLNFPAEVFADPFEHAAFIRKQVGRLAGIPVSIGVASSKTLAKLASERAKKSESGVFEISAVCLRDILMSTPVEDIWGIGRRSADLLRRWGVPTAAHFADKDPLWIRKKFTVRGLMTQCELKGQSCMPVSSDEKRPQSIQVSRTWGSVIESFDNTACAITENVLKAGMLLRREKLLATALSVFIRYGYRHYGSCGYLSRDVRFEEGIMSDRELTDAALEILRKIFIPGYRYTKGGVTLSFFEDASFRQKKLFDDVPPERAKYEKFSSAVDEINRRLGRRAVFPASLAVKDKPWKPHREHLPSRP
jgi:DNA polymerase V